MKSAQVRIVKKWQYLFLMLTALGIVCGCSSASGPVDRIDTNLLDNLIIVEGIEVTNTIDGFGALEVEVHLVDCDGLTTIACVGHNQDMRPVDEPNRYYQVDAAFIDLVSGALITVADVDGRDVAFWVTEDDAGPCPEDFTLLSDDIIGISMIFPGEDLAYPQTWQFDDVVRMETISVDP